MAAARGLCRHGISSDEPQGGAVEGRLPEAVPCIRFKRVQK